MEFIQKAMRYFRKGHNLGDALTITKEYDQVIVKIGSEAHVFVSYVKTLEFLATIKAVNQSAEHLQFDKVFPRCLRYLESLSQPQAAGAV